MYCLLLNRNVNAIKASKLSAHGVLTHLIYHCHLSYLPQGLFFKKVIDEQQKAKLAGNVLCVLLVLYCTVRTPSVAYCKQYNYNYHCYN